MSLAFCVYFFIHTFCPGKLRLISNIIDKHAFVVHNSSDSFFCVLVDWIQCISFRTTKVAFKPYIYSSMASLLNLAHYYENNTNQLPPLSQ